MHDQKQKWKFGSNFVVPYKLPHLQESRPEILSVEKERERRQESTPLTRIFLALSATQEVSFHNHSS